MTYGVARNDTVKLVERYAKMFDVKFSLEPQAPEDVILLSVIYGGALDEEFELSRMNANFVGHVIAGQCVAEAMLDNEDWSVLLSDDQSGNLLWHRFAHRNNYPPSGLWVRSGEDGEEV